MYAKLKSISKGVIENMTDSPFASLKAKLADSIAGAMSSCGYDPKYLENTVDLSKSFGDISCSVAFRVSGIAKRPPQDVAESILAKISKPAMIDKVTADGGFINFHIDRNAFTSDTLKYAIGGEYAPTKKPPGGKVIVEFPSVNPAHPWHIGHLRNALLGDSISKMYGACGYAVEREDYIDDLGLQCAQAVWGTINIDKITVEQGKQRKEDHAIGEVYVAVNKLIEQKPDTAVQVNKVLQLMDRGDTYESKVAKDLAESCVNAQYETAFAFDIYHDVMIWESDIVRGKLLDKALHILDQKKLIKRPDSGKYKGCAVIELADLRNLPKELQGLREEAKVLIRSNGTPNYVAKDIAFHMWKFGIIGNDFKFRKFIEAQPDGKPLYSTGEEGKQQDFGGADTVINPIDTKQSFEQAVVRVVIDCISEDARRRTLKHLAYGVVELESGSISGRKGTWLGYTADDLLREAKERAAALIKDNSNIPNDERDSIAAKVALGSIKFEFLKISPEKKIAFSWGRALNFEGNSGPYSQYMFARASRLLEDSGTDAGTNFDSSVLTGDTEFALIKMISMVHWTAEKARAELRPNVITDYCDELSSCFSRFYDQVPILKAKDQKEKEARLALVKAFANTIAYSLSLLGIPTLKRM